MSAIGKADLPGKGSVAGSTEYDAGAYELLKTIDGPAALRALDRRGLQRLAEELRTFILESVSQTGGHLSSNLGTVELTIALHYVFNTPHDRIVWDVGHQTYPHKILTGRREAMSRIRMSGGISGFPRRSESEYDTFGTAHSSTSVSAALGMAQGAKLKGDTGEKKRHVVAVIGDGAMSAGMAIEALNNAGVMDTDLLVILNDNDMSISPAVGALNRYLARLMSGRFYAAARKAGEKVLGAMPPLWELAKKVEEHAKGLVVPSTLFEEFGFNYVGPIDGHDLDSLVPTLENIKRLSGPQFLHVVTKKGQGYKLAEADPVKYHAASGKFDPAVGFVAPATPPKITYTQIFGQWLFDIPYLRCIPNVSVACPSDENECRRLLTTAFEQDHPVAVRYPRGTGPGAAIDPGLEPLPFGKGQLRREGRRIAVLAFGTVLHPALAAAERIDATVVDMRWAIPIDTALLLDIAWRHEA